MNNNIKKINTGEPVPISDIEDLENFRKNHVQVQKVSFKCKDCGVLVVKSLRLIKSLDDNCCKQCNTKRTCLQKYGYTSATKSKEVQS